MDQLLWNRLCNKIVDLPRILSLYSRNLPINMRHLCAQWIEQRIISDQFNGSDKQVATAFFHQLAVQLAQEIPRFVGDSTWILDAVKFYGNINVRITTRDVL